METQKRPSNRIVVLLVSIIAVLTVAVLALGATVAGLSASLHEPTMSRAEPSETPRQLQKIQDPLAPSYWRGDLEAKPGAVALELRGEGKLVADDGCNVGWGSWSSDDNVRISFGPFVSTLRGCPDLTDLWLYGAAYGEVSADGATMDVYSADGSFLGQLHRIKGIPRSSDAREEVSELNWKLHRGLKFRPYFFHHYHRPFHQPEVLSNR